MERLHMFGKGWRTYGIKRRQFNEMASYQEMGIKSCRTRCPTEF